jgi:ribosome biogenesis GTPase / thiamine phosphate phosphatase
MTRRARGTNPARPTARGGAPATGAANEAARIGVAGQGEVVAAFGRQVEVLNEASGERVTCVGRGKRMDAVCGDHVRFSRTGADATQGVIDSVLARTSVLFRRDAMREKVIAANVTQLVYVVAGEPPFSDELLSRCLAVAEAETIEAVIALNKCDLATARDRARAQLAPYVALGYPVVEIAAKPRSAEAQNVDPLRARLAGHRTLLIGQSGMGKSSLINALVPGARAQTGELSQALSAGRHTTTYSRLYRLPDQSALIDSPGLQAFGLAQVPLDRLAWCFREFRPLLGQCRFADCTHAHEPDCAIRLAVTAGGIEARRLEIYLRVAGENQHASRRALEGGR